MKPDRAHVWDSAVFMLLGEAATPTRIALRALSDLDSESDRTAGNQLSLGALLRCMRRQPHAPRDVRDDG